MSSTRSTYIIPHTPHHHMYSKQCIYGDMHIPMQVQDFELQQETILKSSLHPLSRGLATSSGSRLASPAPPTAPARLGLSSTSQSRMTTPTPTLTTPGSRLNVSRTLSIVHVIDFIQS